MIITPHITRTHTISLNNSELKAIDFCLSRFFLALKDKDITGYTILGKTISDTIKIAISSQAG